MASKWLPGSCLHSTSALSNQQIDANDFLICWFLLIHAYWCYKVTEKAAKGGMVHFGSQLRGSCLSWFRWHISTGSLMVMLTRKQRQAEASVHLQFPFYSSHLFHSQDTHIQERSSSLPSYASNLATSKVHEEVCLLGDWKLRGRFTSTREREVKLSPEYLFWARCQNSCLVCWRPWVQCLTLQRKAYYVSNCILWETYSSVFLFMGKI